VVSNTTGWRSEYIRRRFFPAHALTDSAERDVPTMFRLLQLPPARDARRQQQPQLARRPAAAAPLAERHWRNGIARFRQCQLTSICTCVA